MFARMALLPCLLLLIAGIAVAAPATDSTTTLSSSTSSGSSTTSSGTSSTSDSSQISSTTYAPTEPTTTRFTTTTEDSLSPQYNATTAQSSGHGDYYDQRQEGELNVHVRVDNATVYLVMLDGLGDLVWRKGGKGSTVPAYLSKKIPGMRRAHQPGRSAPFDSLVGVAASPNAVSASPPAAVSASTPPPPEPNTGITQPPRSTYKPPTETAPEPSKSSIIEIKPSETYITEPAKAATKPEPTEPTTSKQETQTSTTELVESSSPKQEPSYRASPKTQARSEEQISILNLLKSKATLSAHSALPSSLRKHQVNPQHPSQR